MIHLNTHLSKRNEDVNEVDDSFEHTFIKEKWRCKWSRWFIWTHEIDDWFEHTLIKEKWRSEHTLYQREMKM